MSALPRELWLLVAEYLIEEYRLGLPFELLDRDMLLRLGSAKQIARRALKVYGDPLKAFLTEVASSHHHNDLVLDALRPDTRFMPKCKWDTHLCAYAIAGRVLENDFQRAEYVAMSFHPKVLDTAVRFGSNLLSADSSLSDYIQLLWSCGAARRTRETDSVANTAVVTGREDIVELLEPTAIESWAVESLLIRATPQSRELTKRLVKRYQMNGLPDINILVRFGDFELVRSLSSNANMDPSVWLAISQGKHGDAEKARLAKYFARRGVFPNVGEIGRILRSAAFAGHHRWLKALFRCGKVKLQSTPRLWANTIDSGTTIDHVITLRLIFKQMAVENIMVLAVNGNTRAIALQSGKHPGIARTLQSLGLIQY